MRFLLSPCCYNAVLLASVRRWAGGSCGAAFGVNYLRSSPCIQAAAVLTAPVPGLSATWRMGEQNQLQAPCIQNQHGARG